MDAERKGRLESYLMNADRFLWGLGPGNQKETYHWLSVTAQEKEWRKEPYYTYSGTYDTVFDELIRVPGIERLISDLIIPRVKRAFGDDTINDLRKFWITGKRPDIDNIKRIRGFEDIGLSASDAKRVNRPYSTFVKLDYKFNPNTAKYEPYISGWSDFAPIWFEEIEKMPEFNSLWQKATDSTKKH